MLEVVLYTRPEADEAGECKSSHPSSPHQRPHRKMLHLFGHLRLSKSEFSEVLRRFRVKEVTTVFNNLLPYIWVFHFIQVGQVKYETIQTLAGLHVRLGNWLDNFFHAFNITLCKHTKAISSGCRPKKFSVRLFIFCDCFPILQGNFWVLFSPMSCPVCCLYLAT